MAAVATRRSERQGFIHSPITEGSDLPSYGTAGTFNMPTLYQQRVWEREANINWSMVTCQGSTRLELP